MSTRNPLPAMLICTSIFAVPAPQHSIGIEHLLDEGGDNYLVCSEQAAASRWASLDVAPPLAGDLRGLTDAAGVLDIRGNGRKERGRRKRKNVSQQLGCCQR